MRRTLALGAAILISTLAQTQTVAKPQGIFANLPQGDRVEVSLESSGCFMNEHFEFVFSRAPALSVAVAEVRGSTRRSLGELRLSKGMRLASIG